LSEMGDASFDKAFLGVEAKFQIPHCLSELWVHLAKTPTPLDDVKTSPSPPLRTSQARHCLVRNEKGSAGSTLKIPLPFPSRLTHCRVCSERIRHASASWLSARSPRPSRSAEVRERANEMFRKTILHPTAYDDVQSRASNPAANKDSREKIYGLPADHGDRLRKPS
jgi:hypothetical protein